MTALCAAGYEARMAALLARRGVADAAAAEGFLRPRLEQLHDPSLLAGLDAAVERLAAARRRGETVVVVGDYDVDGVSGTALLVAVLRACGLQAEAILPHRMRDGYGFQPSHAERAAALGAAVVVTVDCGSTSGAGAEAALAHGLDLVITDHHLPGAALPAGVIHVNPRQEGCAYPFAELSGAGLAFKLALALAAACGRKVDPRALLRVACLGTIADLVPLLGENRVIAALGLEALAETRSPGLRALMRSADLRPPLCAADVGYRLGPRLNAPGRLDRADKALELLLSRDRAHAESLAAELEGWNRERQAQERRVSQEAGERFRALEPLPPILVAWSEGWHRGVVGIAAGRLARELHRPVILLAVDGDSATGSGRGLRGLDLHAFLLPWQDRLERFGGHARAIGLSVDRGRLEGLRDEWQREAEGWVSQAGMRRHEYELEVTAEEVGAELGRRLESLEPHGEGNPRPLLRVAGPLRLAAAPRRFGNGHLSAEMIGPKGGRMRLLGWGWAERRAALDGEVELLGHLERDRYRGGWRLRLLDARPRRAEVPA